MIQKIVLERLWVDHFPLVEDVEYVVNYIASNAASSTLNDAFARKVKDQYIDTTAGKKITVEITYKNLGGTTAQNEVKKTEITLEDI